MTMTTELRLFEVINMLKQFFLSHLSSLYKLLRLNILVVVVCSSVEVRIIIIVDVSIRSVVVSSKKRLEIISIINN